MNIDWDHIRNSLPVYAYEYETESATGTEMHYWYPHNHKGEQPPAGWTRIEREESDPDLWIKAINDWVRNVLKPNEKAVWYDTATGDFSNTFRMGELHQATMDALHESTKERGELGEQTSSWRLIVYRAEYGSDFEFNNLMRVVTKPKEAR